MFGWTLRRILDRAYIALSDVRWWLLAILVLSHALASFELMQWAGEPKLSQPLEFVYWYATTAYTVGYGDLSPQTPAGKMVTALFVFPGAIAAFTTIVAKTLSGMADIWRRRRSGKGNYARMDDSIVLIGFHPERTPRLIEELHAEASHRDRLVLLTRKSLDDPDPRVRYVQAKSLTAAEDLKRAGIETAIRIAIYADTDEHTLAAALAASAMNRSAHIVCYFDHVDSAQLLRLHCPQIECIVAAGAELVARSVRDPGASYVLTALISHLDDSATLFSLEWPAGRATTYGAVAKSLLDRGATVLAAQTKGHSEPMFNPGVEAPIAAGDRIYYVAESRIPVAQVEAA